MAFKGTGAYMMKVGEEGGAEGIVSEWLSGYEDKMYTLVSGNTQRSAECIDISPPPP